MKTKYLLCAFLFCMTSALQLWAYDFEMDGIYYNYIQGSSHEVEITYSNFMHIPNSIKTIEDGALTITTAANSDYESRSSEIILSGENAEDWIIQASQQIANSSEWEYITSINKPRWENNKWVSDWMNKVYAQGNNIVYIVGEKGFIAKSGDCGLTWDEQHFSTQEALNDIIFCNDELGFIVGNRGTILKTENAGADWKQLSSGTFQNLNAIAAANENNIWIVGNNGLIMQSTDIGETWQIRNYTNNRNLYDIKFHDNIGYIVGDRNNILKTDNGGASWNTQIAYNDPREYDKIHSLTITENKVFALLNQEIFLSATHDSNWSCADEGEFKSNSRTGIFFQNDNIGYAAFSAHTTCGGFGLGINQTIDGGQTWEETAISNMSKNIDIAETSNFSFSEDNQFGYFLSGQVILRTPYTGDFYLGLDETKLERSNIILKQQANELQVSSSTKTISLVEILSVTGAKLQQEHGQSETIEINAGNLPEGVYLVRVLFTDKNTATAKWIKQ